MFPAFALSIAAMTRRKIGTACVVGCQSEELSTNCVFRRMEKSGFTWLSSFDISSTLHAPKHNEIDTIDLDKNIIMLVVGEEHIIEVEWITGSTISGHENMYYRFFPRT